MHYDIHAAKTLVKQAYANPEQWFGHSDQRLQSQVVYNDGNNLYTIGTNENYQDSRRPGEAASILLGMWNEEMDGWRDNDLDEQFWNRDA